MNLEIYHNFIKIIDCGTITAASGELHIAQPALSAQLKALEAEYGTELVERGPRHVSLTNAGRILYDKAKRLCLIEDSARKEIQANVRGTMGTLRLGLTPVYPDTSIANLILDFGITYPEIDFELYEENSQILMDLLAKGTIDIAIVRSFNELPDAFAALEEVPLAISRGFKDRIFHNCQAVGFTPTIRCVSSSRYMSLYWATAGEAVAIFVGPVSPDMLPADICCRLLVGTDVETRRHFTIYKERALSAVAQVFLRYVWENTGNLTENVP